jgi:hypothetical protein
MMLKTRFEPTFFSLPSKAEIESKMEHPIGKFLPVRMERKGKPQRHKKHKEEKKSLCSLWFSSPL